MGLSKLWGKDSTGAHGFVFSHIKTIYYNWAQKKLLSTKLDEMDSDTESRLEKSKTLDDYASIMSNQTAGFWPDALAVKEGFAQLNTDISNLSELSAASTTIDNLTFEGGGITFRRIGRMVLVYLQFTQNAPMSSGTNYTFTIPEGFRPVVTLCDYFVQNNNSLFFIYFYASGDAYLRMPISDQTYAGWLYHTMIYFTE